MRTRIHLVLIFIFWSKNLRGYLSMDVLYINRDNEAIEKLVWSVRTKVKPTKNADDPIDYLYCITNSKGIYLPIEIDESMGEESTGVPAFYNFKERRIACRFNNTTLTPRLFDNELDTPSNFNRNVSTHLVSLDIWSYRIANIRYSSGAFLFSFDISTNDRIDMVVGMIDNPTLPESVERPYVEIELYTMNVHAEKILKTIRVTLDNSNGKAGILTYDVKEEIVKEEPKMGYIRSLIPGLITRNVICLMEDSHLLDPMIKERSNIHIVSTSFNIHSQINDIIREMRKKHPNAMPSFFIPKSLRRRSEQKYKNTLEAINNAYYGFPIFKAYDRISVSIREKR